MILIFVVVPGYFSRNGFMLAESTINITYTSWEVLTEDVENIKKSLHVTSLMNIYE